jgi:4'-phosphopantetheinyl transferase
MPVSVLVTSESELSRSQEAEWLSDLPPARRARIGSWTLRRDRHRSLLASRLLLEQLRRLGHPRSALATLRYPQRGRPSLELPLAFSLSHCDGRIAAAVCTEGPVGIDVEKIEPLQAGDFELYLNAAERRWAGASARRFCMIWTRKEAVAKAAGSAGLASLPAVDTSEGADHAIFAGRRWRTLPLDVGAGHVAHVASAEPSDLRVTVEQLPAEALL